MTVRLNIGGGLNKAPLNSSNNGNSEYVDKRVRIRCKPGKQNEIYGSKSSPTNPMKPLHESNGIIFPYTPMIQYKQDPKWSTQELTHFIQQYLYFTATESATLTITGKFTAQNAAEGRYMLAVFHFLRSYNKMYFGTSENENKRGLPPPVLLLDGYGDFMFNGLPIIINTWNMEFPNDVDYVRVSTKTQANQPLNQPLQLQGALSDERRDSTRRRLAGLPANPQTNFSPQTVNFDFSGYAYVPAVTNITISVTVQQPPTSLKRTFNLQDFREGKLLGATKGFT